jgi:hypothetical protein
VRYQVSHPYKITGKIALLYILIFMSVNTKEKTKDCCLCKYNKCVEGRYNNKIKGLFCLQSLFLAIHCRRVLHTYKCMKHTFSLNGCM